MSATVASTPVAKSESKGSRNRGNGGPKSHSKKKVDKFLGTSSRVYYWFICSFINMTFFSWR